MARQGQSTGALAAPLVMVLTLALGPVAATAQSRTVAPAVGDVPVETEVRVIDNLGAVGLGPNLPGSRYAVVAGHLVRIDISSGKILSVLRPLPRKRD